MLNRPPDILVTDSSVLINFLAIDRIDLIDGHPSEFLITDHVCEEIADHYPEQQARLQAGLAQGALKQISVGDPDELTTFRQLTAGGHLGHGECSAIAAAIRRGYRLAIDDNRAAKQARILHPPLLIVRTQDLMVELITHGLLDIPAADSIKQTWATDHRFTLSIGSFAELFPTRKT